MSALTTKIDALMAELQTKVDEYNQLGASLEKTKEELIALQGALNALKELQNAEGDEVTAVEAEVA
jgi:predicted  nucleic acid-binding Zn-ribbon protein